MKGFLFVLSVIVSNTNADTDRSMEESLGPSHFQVKIGDLPVKYVPMDASDMVASENSLALTVKLRQYFETGIGPLPPLDPLRLHDLGPLDIGSNNMISGEVKLMNFYMTGAKGFIVNYGELRLRNRRLDFNVSVPLITAEIDFDADVYFGFVPISLGGHLRMKIIELELNGAMAANPVLLNGNKVLQVDSIDVEATAQNITVQVSQIQFGDEDISDEKLSIATWFGHLKDIIANNVVKTAIKEINNVLQHFPVDAALKYILRN